jgi:DNA-directed RNA polymerase II subunit RPB1
MHLHRSIAAQSIGEPTSQMTLNTKHSAGSKTSVNSGVNRILELLHYTKKIKTPQMIIYFKEPYSNDRQKLNKIVSFFKHLTIKDLINLGEIYFDLGQEDILSNKLKNDNVDNPFFGFKVTAISPVGISIVAGVSCADVTIVFGIVSGLCCS